MFRGCTSLVETPKGWYLPVQKGASYSCNYIFYNCTKLQKMAVAYSTYMDSSEWGNFLGYVSKTGTFFYSKNQTKENIKYIVPSGWTLVQSTEW